MKGRIAIVTGGRVKIGFQTVLKLLRDGAEVIVTTRFPQDAAKRYIELSDFSDWKLRLHIYGLDLRLLILFLFIFSILMFFIFIIFIKNFIFILLLLFLLFSEIIFIIYF